MSFTVNGGTVLTECVKLTGTALTDILVAKGKTLIIAIYAGEINGATPTLDIAKTDGTTTFYLRKNKAMTAGETLLLDTLISLKNGEKLQAKASAANQIDIWVSYLAADKTALGVYTAPGR